MLACPPCIVTSASGLLIQTSPAIDVLFPAVDSDALFAAFGATAINGEAGIPIWTWVVILLVYAFIASAIPVTILLQPRDYINAWQLFVAMGLLISVARDATEPS